jgi:hypothetical protein
VDYGVRIQKRPLITFSSYSQEVELSNVHHLLLTADAEDQLQTSLINHIEEVAWNGTLIVLALNSAIRRLASAPGAAALTYT